MKLMTAPSTPRKNKCERTGRNRFKWCLFRSLVEILTVYFIQVLFFKKRIKSQDQKSCQKFFYKRYQIPDMEDPGHQGCPLTPALRAQGKKVPRAFFKVIRRWAQALQCSCVVQQGGSRRSYICVRGQRAHQLLWHDEGWDLSLWRSVLDDDPLPLTSIDLLPFIHADWDSEF